MGEIERIVEQLRQVHEGEAWHGPSVREAIEGVTAKAAVKRPVLAAHSIRELVHHIRVTDEAVRAHVAFEDAAAVKRSPEERLHENVPGNGHSYWYELLGILHHDLYHAGQIALLRKAVA
jgi:hypothetical protein